MKSKPIVRFKGFNDDWEQRKLSYLLHEYSKKSKKEDEYIILSSTNNGMEKREGRVSGSTNIGYKILEPGDLVLSPQNLWLGNINVNDLMMGLVSPSYKTYTFKNIVSDFIKPQLRLPRMIHEYKLASTQGASVVRRNLDLELFEEIAIKTPDIKEQNQIGSLFNELDQTITLHQRKWDLVKTMKETMSENLIPENRQKNFGNKIFRFHF